MKSFMMCACTAFVFFVATAGAQTSTYDPNSPNPQGTQSSSPSMQQGSSPSTSPTTQTPPTPDSTQGSMAGNPNSSTAGMKGDEKKMKGCIQSQGGQYVLQTKRGKDITLTGQDVSAHVGHEVTVHGMWEGAAADMSGTSSGNTSATSKAFNVTSVDMISDSCKGLSKEKSSTQPQ